MGIKSILELNHSVKVPFTDKHTVPSLELYTSCNSEIEVGIGILETKSDMSADKTIGIQP